MLKFAVFIVLSINLFAQDLVELYRTKGISSVESAINEKMKEKAYWKSFLQDKDVSYGYYETKKYVILTQKLKGLLSLYKKENNNFKLLLTNNVIVGEKEGDKYVEGDKKTPEGAYDLIEKKDRLDQFYGPFALVTSYPNNFDKTLNKKGYGIWIHGMPLDGNREQYTKGCIALDNPELKKLEKSIDIGKAVLLTTSNDFREAKKDDIATILATIFQWKDAWKKSDLKTYMTFYSKKFKKHNGMNYKAFKDYKRRVFSKNEKKSIKFSDINISPYPNSLKKNMYKVVMNEDYLSPSVKFVGEKELFLEIVKGKVEILAED